MTAADSEAAAARLAFQVQGPRGPGVTRLSQVSAPARSEWAFHRAFPRAAWGEPMVGGVGGTEGGCGSGVGWGAPVRSAKVSTVPTSTCFCFDNMCLRELH